MSDRLVAAIARQPELFRAFPGKSHPKDVKAALGVIDRQSGLTECQMCKIMEAKSERLKSRVLQNGSAVARVTAEAFSQAERNKGDNETPIATLCGLDFVNVSIASAVMSWCFSSPRFPVIDRHSWRSFRWFFDRELLLNGKNARIGLSKNVYLRYRRILVDIAKERYAGNRDASDIDYWLYAYSRIYGGPLSGSHKFANAPC